MSMKKTDLAKNMALKIHGQLKNGPTPDRFAQGASNALDKREQRKRDAAAGLVPFSCKLPATLVRQLHARAADHEGGLNAWIADMLKRSID